MVPNPYAVQVRDLEWETFKRYATLEEASKVASRLRRASETVRVMYMGVKVQEIQGPFAMKEGV